MNKKNISLIAFTIIACIVMYLILTLETPRIYNYFQNISIDQLREKINAEMQNTHINSGRPLIIDNVCGLENKTGTCYFNSSLQALFANRQFTLFIIMSKFNTNQVVSVIMQKIAHKLLTNREVSLLDEIDLLTKVPSLSHAVKRVGGDVSYCIPKLLQAIDEECFGVKTPGSPQNFYIHEKVSFRCDKCIIQTVQVDKYPIYDVDFGSSFSHCFTFSLNIKRFTSKNKMYKCNKCKKFNKQENAKIEFVMPENFIVSNGRSMLNHNKYEFIYGEIENQEHVMIDKWLFELYSMVCLYKPAEGLHVKTIAKKGKDWYLMDDNIIKKIKLEDNKDVKENAWIYFYRRIE